LIPTANTKERKKIKKYGFDDELSPRQKLEKMIATIFWASSQLQFENSEFSYELPFISLNKR
jgi:hypothetical protein